MQEGRVNPTLILEIAAGVFIAQATRALLLAFFWWERDTREELKRIRSGDKTAAMEPPSNAMAPFTGILKRALMVW